ncbi:heat repeat-containing protein [Cyclospora cayetanensis]|uniref:Heat repeat-containing protein n=1 Tax=Cyclospora cayetanensis TaxID=88456 RepID=A0A1D3CZG7_9EIME|nr:heat repeat-containing protein [Cyclospora cayetanensis]
MVAGWSLFILRTGNPENACPPEAPPQGKTKGQSLLAEEVLRGEKEETRQLAAVLLRRKAAKFFSSLQPNQQSEFTESLVGRLGCEPSKPVRHSLAYVESGDGTETFFDELLHIFQQALTISNNNPALAGPALEGLRGLAEDAVEPSQQKKLFALLPGVTAVIEKAFQPEGDESVAMGALELIDDLAAGPRSHTLGSQAEASRYADEGLEEGGCRVQYVKDLVLCKGGFVPKLLDVLVEMAAQPDEPGCAVLEDEDDEDEELNPHRLACQTVDAIAVALPNKHICKPLLQRLEAYIHPTAPRTPEQEVLQQRAALTCIGIMSEGCEAALRGKLKAFMPFLIPLLQHSHPAVAAAAALCFGQFAGQAFMRTVVAPVVSVSAAEYLQPEIMQYQSQVLPLLLQQLDNPNRLVQHKACYALDVLLESMGPDDLAPVVGPVVQKLVDTLQRTPSDSVREVCLSAIRSAAVASVAEEDDGEARPQGTPRPFDPYAADLFRLLEDIIRSPTVPRGNSGGAGTAAAGCSPATKARAIGVIGGLVKGLSPQCYQQQLRQLLQLVVQQVDGGEGQGEAAQESAHEIRDEAFACFRDVSSALKEEFVPFLEDVMVRVLASLFSSEGFTSPEEPGDFDLGDSGDESTGAGRELQIRDGYLDELDSAAFCLRSLWENCGGHCMKYLQKTCEAIEVLKTHFHDAARQQASFLIAAVLLAAHKTLANPQEQHSQQQAQGTVQCMQPHVLQLWKTQLYPLLFAIISEDVDKETVGDAFSALGTVLEGVGPAAIYSAEQRESLLLQCSNLLRGKHICQLNQDVDEVFREMQGSAVQYAESPAVLKAVGSGISQEEDEDCRRNACFCLSVIYEDLNKSEQSTVDNACSAVASMLLHAPPSGLPMGDVVRVFLSSLPLQADREESKTVLQALLHLAATQSDIVLQNSEQFMFACACEASFPGAARRIGSELTASAQQLLQEMCKNPQLPSGTLDALATRLQSKPYALAFLRQ